MADRLKGRHFLESIEKGVKKTRKCHVCYQKAVKANVPAAERRKHRKVTSYRCKTCKVPLCLEPCMERFHTDWIFYSSFITLILYFVCVCCPVISNRYIQSQKGIFLWRNLSIFVDFIYLSHNFFVFFYLSIKRKWSFQKSNLVTLGLNHIALFQVH